MKTDTDYPPLAQLPTELSDETAAQLLEFLYELARALENAYAPQLHRYYHTLDQRPLEIRNERDPPF